MGGIEQLLVKSTKRRSGFPYGIECGYTCKPNNYTNEQNSIGERKHMKRRKGKEGVIFKRQKFKESSYGNGEEVQRNQRSALPLVEN